MLNRRLVLRREALAPLSTDEMAALAGAGGGGGPQPTPPIYAPRTLDANECLGTSFDSLLVCTLDCMSNGTSCNC